LMQMLKQTFLEKRKFEIYEIVGTTC
jgi:hypothetical protein